MPEEGDLAEPEPPAQSDPTGRWTRTNHVLGKGAFKVVYKGFDQEEGIEVAWNQIRMNELVSTKDDRERLYAEIRVLKQLKHKNIMTFHDSWLEQKGYTLNFITELFTSGTLRQYRKRHRSTDPEVMKRWAWQILCGLVYLHGHAPPIIHRDLKCDNIFINGSEGVVKIGDLGLATMLRARTAPQSVLGTPEFMAPELYDEEYDDRVDVYSFGMCMLELATLEYPYNECRNAAQIYRKVTLGVRPKALSKVDSRELAEIISLCLARREERPRARQLLKHPYFDSIRSEKLALKLGQEALGVQDPCQPMPELAPNTVQPDAALNGSVHSSNFLESVREEPEEQAHDNRSDQQETEQGSDTFGGLLVDGVILTGQQGSMEPMVHHLDDDREFNVHGHLHQHDDKLQLRLKIRQPDGPVRTVEFTFDLASDTAISVASEMVEEMHLSHSDANKISQAIKAEILTITRYGSRHGSVAHSLDSASEEEGSIIHSDEMQHEPMMRQGSTGTKYEAAHCPSRQSHHSLSQELEPINASTIVTQSTQHAPQRQDVTMREATPRTPCSDSVTSVNEHFSEASPPDNLYYTQARPIVTRPHSSLGFFQAPSSQFAASAPGSTVSLGSPPAREQAGSEPAPGLCSPSATSARENLASALPPRGNFLRPSESLLRHLGRTDSANHAQEMEALQQALAEKGHSRLFNLPPEEDRRLPLMKLLETLEGSAESVPMSTAQSGSLITPARLSPPAALSLPATSQEMRDSVRPASTTAASYNSSLLIPEFRRSAEGISRGTSPASSTSKQMQESGREFQSQPNLAGMAMFPCKSENLGDSPGVVRAKSKADLLEARRQAAQTSLKNMESNCLEGLDAFGGGASRAKQQVPIRKMMGAPGNRAA